jgi:hypothetical protein
MGGELAYRPLPAICEECHARAATTEASERRSIVTGDRPFGHRWLCESCAVEAPTCSFCGTRPASESVFCQDLGLFTWYGRTHERRAGLMVGACRPCATEWLKSPSTPECETCHSRPSQNLVARRRSAPQDEHRRFSDWGSKPPGRLTPGEAGSGRVWEVLLECQDCSDREPHEEIRHGPRYA